MNYMKVFLFITIIKDNYCIIIEIINHFVLKFIKVKFLNNYLKFIIILINLMLNYLYFILNYN
jgi:hypothetical protein